MASSIRHDPNQDAATKRSEDSPQSRTESSPSPEGAILGGGMRGLIGLLSSTMKVKMMVYKRAFLTIGDQAMGQEKNVSVPTSSRLLHSKLLVYTQSTLMGMVVFCTYDVLVHAWHYHRHRRTEGSVENAGVVKAEDLDFASIWIHAIAGAASGVSRSLFWLGWERLVYEIPHSWMFAWRTTVHHATGHGVLFGSYYGIRTLFLESCARSGVLVENEKKVDDGGSYSAILATFVAGGLAGQMHHVSQHYTSHWRQYRSLHQLPPPPRIRPLAASFLPMAICFAVFEHGAESAEDLVAQVQATFLD